MKKNDGGGRVWAQVDRAKPKNSRRVAEKYDKNEAVKGAEREG